MAQPAPTDEDIFAPREIPLGGDFLSYITALMRKAPGEITFRTGSGRLFRDLLLHWPALNDWEDEAHELCQRVTDAVYPLTGSLYAQAVEITATISPRPITHPARIEAMSTCVVFDADSKTERHKFIAPDQAEPENDEPCAAKGIVVLCRPLNYRYHTIRDDRGRGRGMGTGVFEWPERMINEMLYEQPDFVPQEKKILETLQTQIQAMPKAVEDAEESREANLALQSPRFAPRPSPQIANVTSLSALPPPVHALERRLMVYVGDKNLSPELRLGLRRIAQNMRTSYPQAMIEEAAQRETAPAAFKPKPAARQTPQPRPDSPPKAQAMPRPAPARPPAPVPPPARPVPKSISQRPTVLMPASAATAQSSPQAPIRFEMPPIVSPRGEPVRTAPQWQPSSRAEIRAAVDQSRAAPAQPQPAARRAEPSRSPFRSAPQAEPARAPARTQPAEQRRARPAPKSSPRFSAKAEEPKAVAPGRASSKKETLWEIPAEEPVFTARQATPPRAAAASPFRAAPRVATGAALTSFERLRLLTALTKGATGPNAGKLEKTRNARRDGIAPPTRPAPAKPAWKFPTPGPSLSPFSLFLKGKI